MICTQPARAAHTTTKWVMPLALSTTPIAGRAAASRRNTCSAGIITCSTSRPSDPAISSSVSIEVPSTSLAGLDERDHGEDEPARPRREQDEGEREAHRDAASLFGREGPQGG